MNKKDSLGDSMKEYEGVSRNYLTRRVPVIIRLDGKAFHTFTRGMKKPFDDIMMGSMQETMKRLCEEVQGCVFGYTQSDEITLVLTDYATIKTDAWFGYNVQKMTSVAASIATLAFNNAYSHILTERMTDHLINYPVEDMDGYRKENDYFLCLDKKRHTAMFDARAFSLPKDEVCNCLIWRQQDATRNSIEAAGHANFSQKELHGKSCNEIQEMLFNERGINWNDYPTDCKRGSACYKVQKVETIVSYKNPEEQIDVERNVWVIDDEIPIFSQEREFVERFL